MIAVSAQKRSGQKEKDWHMGKRREAAQLKPERAGSRVRPTIGRISYTLLHSGKLFALLLAALSGWVLYDALQSPRYRVRVVEAPGAQALTQDDVAALANVRNQSIWYIQPTDIEARVALSPYVERVRARIVLPDRLLVTVVERKPDVRWIHDGKTYAVTWDGLVLDLAADTTAPPAAPATNPLTDTAPISGTPPLSETVSLSNTNTISSTEPISASSALTETETEPPVDAPRDFVSVVTIFDTTPNRPLKIGDHVDADALELARRVTLRAPNELPAPVTRIEWDAGLGLSLIMGEGRQVVLGKSNDLDRKLVELRYLLQENTAFKYLDLRPATPYYK